MTDYRFFEKAQAGKDLPTTSGGASSYFSSPSDTLDPNLFDGMKLRDEVRHHVTGSLLLWLIERGYEVDPQWLHIWIAGSGVTYQWDANRGNGDLDVLFSIDITPFEQANPDLWRGASEVDLAAGINDDLKRTLWPGESETRFGNQTYEVTYYFNAGTGKDIRNIHPYAAYDVITDTWAVPPPHLPSDPRSLYPNSWYISVAQDHEAAVALTEAYKASLTMMDGSAPGSPTYHTAGSLLNVTVAKAQALFQDIHGGRRDAFGPQGHGYGDFANFRHQSAKEAGVYAALYPIVTAARAAKAQEETELYGAPIDPAEVVLRRAANQHRDRT